MHAFWNIKNLKPPGARKKAVRHVSDSWASFLAIGGFVILYHKIPWFFHDYSGFSNSMIFPCMELFLVIFQGFPWFPELVGTLIMLHFIWVFTVYQYIRESCIRMAAMSNSVYSYKLTECGILLGSALFAKIKKNIATETSSKTF